MRHVPEERGATRIDAQRQQLSERLTPKRHVRRKVIERRASPRRKELRRVKAGQFAALYGLHDALRNRCDENLSLVHSYGRVPIHPIPLHAARKRSRKAYRQG